MSSDEAGPALPKGVLRRKGAGWSGEELEMEHAAVNATKSERSSGYVTVDKSQFFNTEVGSGYQAKHVVRQKGAGQGDSAILDMTKPRSTPDKRAKKRKEQSNEASFEDHSGIEEFLRCKGLRCFKRELVSLIRSDKS
uniref:Uncharacterized protein n=1 Tax=Leptocylindrus danicus TaxID=163516 RepID=A0A7S2KP25_9STRA|mmetsp:Transcript_24947/g.37319  ORF Transcript_24947/g.37319 Transcript_24947/m.37319 type:complete len:138 (+) Transcript_24947:70-483(+)